MKFQPISGLVTAPHTPFKADGSLNLALIEKQAELFVANGIQGVFVCGSTGEGVSMSTAERMAVTQRWVDVADKTLQVIVHVGHNSYVESSALAAHARKIKASSVSAVAPHFFKPASDDLVEFLVPIAKAAGSLPIYYYHIPVLSGVNLRIVPFLEQVTRRIPNFVGIKFTLPDLMEYSLALNFAGGKYDIPWGVDEMFLGGLSFGARGAVGSTYNFMAPLFHRLIDAFNRGDLDTARKLQAQSVDIVRIYQDFGGISTGKAMMAMLGVDCGPVRYPCRPLTAQQIKTIHQRARAVAGNSREFFCKRA